jgi:uncharacterized membrane protein
MIPAVHLHLILNHLPVVGSLFALALLAWGFWRRSEVLQRAGLAAVIMVAVAALAAYFTGEPAWEDIMDLPGDNDPYILAHQRAAQFAFGAASLTGIMAMITLATGRRRRPVVVWLVIGVLMFLLATAGLMGYAANLGGMIRHTEIRPGGVAAEVKK